jgi:epoxyqueuosine reductase
VKHRLTDLARATGFNAIGFARARRLDAAITGLERWIAAGRHAAMNWMARDPEQRGTPPEWARTVIALAVGYPPLRRSPGSPLHAAYADHADYHKKLRAMMNPLADLIRAEGGRATRFVDTGAMLEKSWAAEAGIGFIGRNRLLITEARGPFAWLGLIVTDLEIEPDTPSSGDCGDCRLCLEACPNGALDDQGLDARRCIAYLTIEAPQPLARDEEKMVGNWEFGCDLCLEACPHAARALPAVVPAGRGLHRRTVRSA